MTPWVLIFLGSGLGGALRYGVNTLVTRALGDAFPYGILFINVLGSSLIGIAVGFFAFKGDVPYNVRLFLTTGILGGFTTFSAFSLDAVLLIERGQPGLALIYILASVALSIGCLVLALLCTRLI